MAVRRIGQEPQHPKPRQHGPPMLERYSPSCTHKQGLIGDMDTLFADRIYQVSLHLKLLQLRQLPRPHQTVEAPTKARGHVLHDSRQAEVRDFEGRPATKPCSGVARASPNMLFSNIFRSQFGPRFLGLPLRGMGKVLGLVPTKTDLRADEILCRLCATCDNNLTSSIHGTKHTCL